MPNRKSPRLKKYDYSQNGYYFVTICTKNMIDYFGNIENGEMALSGTGLIAQQYWLEIPKHFPFVALDIYTIMPDHVHGILIINNKKCRDAINRVPTSDNPQYGGITGNYNPMHENSLSKIVRWYKGRTTFEIHKLQAEKLFQWQPRFYDHIIRNEKSLHDIRQYIQNNPMGWELDPENPANMNSR